MKRLTDELLQKALGMNVTNEEKKNAQEEIDEICPNLFNFICGQYILPAMEEPEGERKCKARLDLFRASLL